MTDPTPPGSREPRDIAIGPAEPEDYEWAADLMASSEPWLTLGRGLEASREYLGPHADAELHVARSAGRPCGFVFVRPRGFAGSPYLASIAVAPDARRRGVGTALLASVEKRYAGSARHIFLLVSSFNPGARRLYERVGYRAVGEIPGFIVEGSSEVVMARRLVP